MPSESCATAGWSRSWRCGASQAHAQMPEGPAPAQPVCTRRGRIHRMFHHVSHTAVDKFVGYPDTFIEPPLGYYANEQFSVQVAKANTHRFTFYRSDFLPGTCQFSPAGASRFNIMTARVPAWMGPITVEWTPDDPALAEQRRAAVVQTMAQGWLAGPGRSGRDRAVAVPWSRGSRGRQQFREHRLARPGCCCCASAAAGRVGRHGSSLKCVVIS